MVAIPRTEIHKKFTCRVAFANLRQRGVTLVELIAAITIMAIVSTMVVPLFSSMIARHRVTSRTNGFLSALSYARSAAVLRGRRVVVCRRASDTACVPIDDTSSGWEQGWLIFVDVSNDAVIDAGEEILRVQAPFGNIGTIIGTAGDLASYVSYSSDGRARLLDGTSQVGTVSICDAASSVPGAVLLNFIGRARTDSNCAKADSCAASCP